jgi:hypothetical protein
LRKRVEAERAPVRARREADRAAAAAGKLT